MKVKEHIKLHEIEIEVAGMRHCPELNGPIKSPSKDVCDHLSSIRSNRRTMKDQAHTHNYLNSLHELVVLLGTAATCNLTANEMDTPCSFP